MLLKSINWRIKMINLKERIGKFMECGEPTKLICKDCGSKDYPNHKEGCTMGHLGWEEEN